MIETARSKRARFRDPRVTMAHGAGGKATQTLIEGLLAPAFASPALDAMGDAGIVAAAGTELALTTDSFVVRPIRFPGGSIGELAVNGTVNDLAVAGARPLALTLAMILEEGLAAEDLAAEVAAIAAAAEGAGVEVVAGDTKVVERGHADAMYLTTTGLGLRDPRAALSPDALRPGDHLLVSGPVGRARHGDHARARRVRARRGDRVGHALALADGRRAPGCRRERAAVPARRHPRRRRVGAQRAGAVVGRRDDRARGGGAGGAGGAGRRRDPRHRPALRRQRGGARGRRGARGGRGGPRGACAARRAARAPRRSAR